MSHEEELIKKTLKHYIDGAKSGKGDDMKSAFHCDATIFGYIGGELFSGPIQKLYDWNDSNGPASRCSMAAVWRSFNLACLTQPATLLEKSSL